MPKNDCVNGKRDVRDEGRNKSAVVDDIVDIYMRTGKINYGVMGVGCCICLVVDVFCCWFFCSIVGIGNWVALLAT